MQGSVAVRNKIMTLRIFPVMSRRKVTYVPAAAVIGVLEAIFKLVMPQSILRYQLKDMTNNNDIVAHTASFLSCPKHWAMHVDKSVGKLDRVGYWSTQLTLFNFREKT